MPVKQCPYCDLIWAPRKESPRWCPRCKRWIKGMLKDVTDTDNWAVERQRPVWKEKGEILILPYASACSLCGTPQTRLIQLRESDLRLCGECIARLLKDGEEILDWKV